MPKIYEKWQVTVDGASYTYYWQNKLHVFNDINIRRTTPIPPKDSNVFRIVVFGDSMTYGQGVDVTDAYPSG